MFETILQFDQRILFFIQEYVVTNWLSPLMILFTKLGDAGFIWIVMGLFFLIKPQTRKVGFLIFGAMILTAILGEGILKNIFQRPRPYDQFTAINLLVGQSTPYSFPSGHTSSSFAVAYVVSTYLPRLRGLVWPLTILVTFSRLYLFMHYPTDILGGILLGLTCGFLVSWVYQYSQERKLS